MATKKSAKKKGIPVAGVAAGVAAAAAAAGAAYYFYGSKKAPQHRKAAVKWAHDMKRDVVREAKKLQKIDDVVMHEVIDRVAGTYKAGEVTAADLKSAVSELKDNWRKIRTEAKSGGRTVTKTAKKVAKTAKKATKKRSR